MSVFDVFVWWKKGGSCQKQGWRLRQVHGVHHILMLRTEGQDVVPKILDVFVNRWRHVLANITSLCSEAQEGTGNAAFNFERHEGLINIRDICHFVLACSRISRPG